MKPYLILCLWMTISALKAQTFDDVIATRRYVDCYDVTFNATSFIADLYSKNQVDSLYKFLDYWETKCGFMESTFRLRNILDIKTGRFQPDSISGSWIELLMTYKRNTEYRPPHMPMFNRTQYDLFLEKQKFDSLTRHIASQTLAADPDGSLLLDFYSTRSPNFERIRSAPEPSSLRALHQRTYLKTLRQPVFHKAIITGLVQHYGNISVFGARPNFGIIMGGKTLRHNYDVILDFRAGPSKEQYSFVYQDSVITHDKWTGMYVGLEYAFDIVTTSLWDIGISPGIGYDRITAMTTENEYGEEAMFLPSFNKNIGVVFRFKFPRNDGYLGLHLRYNWTDYDNPGGTTLDGQYLNVRLTLGSTGDYWRTSRLRNLE